jgi:hypothetical protein
MATDHSEVEAKLQRLGERVRLGWARPQPMTAQERELVRQAVGQQWQREEAVRQKLATARQAEKVRLAKARKALERGPSKATGKRARDRGIDQDDGHRH